MIKKILFVFSIIFVFVIKSNAQQSKIKDTKNTSASIPVEIPAEYPGGIEELIKYIIKNISYANALDKNNQTRVGTVRLSFVIEKDGSIGDTIIVTQSLNEYYDNEAVRIVRSLPNWIPGTQNGNPTRTQIKLPINF